ncbi:MAG: hypothetical protein QM487_11760 [Candidatus Marithrix sp.]
MDWKTTAISSIPEDRGFITECKNPFEFWLDMYQEFIILSKKSELDKAKRIVKLALSSISNEDKISMEMGQATLISFFHDIASNKDIWKYIPVYFSKNDLEILSQEFIYVLGHEGYIELIDEFNKNT